ncbi:MAG: hypothetical protein ACI9VN_001301 [Patescibacteria group bacterium]
MNQFNWTYLGGNGKNHNVGMYHGAESGHLLVYCNNKIMLVDFKILKTSSYSFFIEDELCELEIELRDGKFYYGFNINKTADTPLNRIRKKKEIKHLYQSLGFIAGILLLIFTTFMIVNNWQDTKQVVGITTLLHEFGEEASAKILIASENEDHSVSYYFIVNGRGYTVKSEKAKEGVQLYQHGMPLEKGDEFVIRYLPENPNTCSIDYNRPTPSQVETYLKRAAMQYASKNPSVTDNESECLTKLAYELKGISGLADFYFQDVAVSDNPKHNVESFQRLVRDIPFQEEREKRCGI